MTEPAASRWGTPGWRVAALALLLVGAFSWGAWRLAALSRSKVSTPDERTVPMVAGGVVRALPSPVVAPALDLPTAGGGRFTSSQALGQVVVLNFWATWCEPCRLELPLLIQLQADANRRYPGKLRVVAVAGDEDPAAVERYFASPPFSGIPPEIVVALDPGGAASGQAFRCAARSACRAEDVRYPETVVLDRRGRIVALMVGYSDWNTPGAMRLLEALIDG